MYRVLLADDEQVTRKYLSGLIDWESHGYIVVGIAHNGQQAFDMFCAHQPDIVITDIQMPLKDGLLFAQEIMEKNPQVYIIFLTAHEESEYAIKAINMGIKRYLLKYQIDAERLCNELMLANNALTERNAEVSSGIIKELGEMLVGRQSCNRLKDTLSELGFASTKGFLTVAASIDRHYRATGLVDDYQNARNALVRLLASKQKEAIKHCFCEVEYNRFVLLVQKQGGFSERELCTAVHFWLQDAASAFAKATTDTVSIAVDTHVVDAAALPAQAAQLFDLLSSSAFLGNNWQILTPCPSPTPLTHMGDIGTAIAKALTLLQDNQMHELKKLVYEIFEETTTQQMASELALSLLNEFLVSLRIHQLDYKSIYNYKERELSSYFAAKTRADYVEWFFCILAKAQPFIGVGYDMSLSPKIRMAISYIAANYSQKITLAQMAAYLQLSEGYFCYLFKKEMQKSFITYLNEYRVAKAEQLLRETPMKVYEVSAEVGFENFQYFSMIFRKFTGKSPSRYQRSD